MILFLRVQVNLQFLFKLLLTGAAGFEPANGGVKVHSLTTWRRPREIELEIQI